ncbi:hypothetical protein HRR81_004065 [Exophiala dermatitidis]|uniref:Secreted protein n=1 Tax=Exophiala dermatitidis TaxID=5970 RepID=A0AAN6ERA0_EXODE|nr:hypothetical protein HRR73_007097 [Exophiala dermatitidis]KAJ4509430.1 hypothetical protein HRR74_007211 [Exophiala dermatitidis]KAJ4571730.1 hypothetical protein HRR82_007018 [Exophiala dermatitidis]KAJ4576177.1 hypothetical protein HRR81_004065 [Exophiala dermatitidis]KAJ4679705.1 hypothetical protein HRR93_002663 [Exophiala dermatitidis]
MLLITIFALMMLRIPTISSTHQEPGHMPCCPTTASGRHDTGGRTGYPLDPGWVSIPKENQGGHHTPIILIFITSRRHFIYCWPFPCKRTELKSPVEFYLFSRYVMIDLMLSSLSLLLLEQNAPPGSPFPYLIYLTSQTGSQEEADFADSVSS